MVGFRSSINPSIIQRRSKMNTSMTRKRWLIYFVIFLSGASGLIYQVVWHKYLAILLGAQARATAVVLAIFLGGLGSGYLCFGKWSRDKGWNLISCFCLLELGLSCWAL